MRYLNKQGFPGLTRYNFAWFFYLLLIVAAQCVGRPPCLPAGRQGAAPTILPGLAFAADGAPDCAGCAMEDSMVFETYYPSPYGLYEELRGDKIIVGDTDGVRIQGESTLPPSGTLTFHPVSRASVTAGTNLYEGTMYYNSDDHKFQYYDNTSNWKDLGGGGDYWKPSTVNANDIYYSQSGNVGIGTTIPQATLDITGSLSAKANNDTLTALHINPSFNNGSFSSVKHNSLVIDKGNLLVLPGGPRSNPGYEDFEDADYFPWVKGITNTGWEPQFTTGYNGGLGLKLNGNVVSGRDPYGEHQNIVYTSSTPKSGTLSLWLKLAASGASATIYTPSVTIWGGGSSSSYANWTYLTFQLTNVTQIVIQALYGDLYIDNLSWGGGETIYDAQLGIGTSSPQASLDIGPGCRTLADSWSTRSSLRFKENLYPIDNALTKLSSLQGVYFDYKDTHKHSLGLVAEDVGRVFPELVTYEANGTDAVGLDYDKLNAVTIEAVKEQQKEIEELKKNARNQQKEIELLRADKKVSK